MLFQSPQFFLFFCLFFPLYWTLARWLRLQNLLTLIASYTFYGWWDPRLLLLIVATSGFDFCSAIQIEQSASESRRRAWLRASLVFNLSILGFFKYYNFFAGELEQLLKHTGLAEPGSLRLDIILPVGISFYTFQTLSYSVDVFNRKLPAARDPVLFFTYIAFFPQLVAGPIERATHLLPQFTAPRVFSHRDAVRSSRLLLWGFFKKLAVADSCAIVVDRIFTAPDQYSGWHLLAGAIAFSLQIYGDFSGYSDIARGTAGLLGVDLMENFRFPYFSQSPAEFWRRWHISLSTWFRDYVYIPSEEAAAALFAAG
jgi:alginate O-acetyltransferase complex protein AlgI